MVGFSPRSPGPSGQISEIKVQILAIDENVRAQAQRELRAIEAKLAELAEREIATSDKLRRIDIRSPLKGIVHELSVHTIGGVVTAAEQIMLIVPEEENLTVQARIAPTDIDQVAIGRSARLRLTAFAQQKTPELDARVVHMSADVTTDPKTGQATTWCGSKWTTRRGARSPILNSSPACRSRSSWRPAIGRPCPIWRSPSPTR